MIKPTEDIPMREIAIRMIEAYLTADKMVHRKPKAEQILFALERLGYHRD